MKKKYENIYDDRMDLIRIDKVLNNIQTAKENNTNSKRFKGNTTKRKPKTTLNRNRF